VALSENSIDCIGHIWRIEKETTPFHYAERVLEWHYAPTHILRNKYVFRFALVKKNERFYKWVPNTDWGQVMLWLHEQAVNIRYLHKGFKYSVNSSLFEESDIPTVIYQLEKLQESLKPVHRKTVGRLLRRGVVVSENGMLVVSKKHLNNQRMVFGHTRGFREGLNGVGNHNKPLRYNRWQLATMQWQAGYEERQKQREQKEAKAAQDAVLLQKKMERRAKIAAKKKNRKYNRAVIKNREQHGQDYIWW
jgi:hypothetical protein